MVSSITMMMKTESFNWQRPAKICNGVEDFGLLREKLTNVDSDTKRRSFSSIFVSRTVFIVGVIAIITFIMCLVLADKYQKSINLTHHYASFVYEKSRDYSVQNSEDGDTGRDENSPVGQGIFNAAGFMKLQNISNRLPIEEINLLVPATTVLRSLNVSRTGRQYSGVSGDNLKKMPQAIVVSSARNISQQSTPTNTTTGAKKTHRIQSLADLLRRTELKAVPTQSSTGTATDTTSGVPNNRPTWSTSPSTTNKPTTTTNPSTSSISTTTVPSSTQQTSIHFAQLESYPHRMQPHNNNLQHLIEYINCESSSEDCWLKRQQQRHHNVDGDAITITVDDQHHQIRAEEPKPTTFVATQQLDRDQGDRDREYEFSEQLDSEVDGQRDENGYANSDHQEDDTKRRMQTTEQHQHPNDGSPFPTTENDDSKLYGYRYEYRNGNDGDGTGTGTGTGSDNDKGDSDDAMFTADTQMAPSYYSPAMAPAAPYFALHRNRVDSDLFRNFRASSPVEINRLQLHDQTESATSTGTGTGTGTGTDTAAEQSLQHRFSNRMYHSRGGDMDMYTLDLDPYLKPPTPPPPTTLSFTPSYSTLGFHAFNDPLAMASAPLPSAFSDNDLRSEATAVQPLTSQVKPISLMVEIFPANEYELPGSVLGGGGGASNSNDNRATPFTAQQRDQTQSNQANIASLMSWKLAPFSQNKMRLLVNLFPQHRPPVTGKHSPLSDAM
ncbi:uncharacterized protein LOC135849424 [Planococcus citri]|uniref:uncharacterized protein LOC135849424 n=1 Tax=Planococcus citri TaxID=170843 RepID=UPI0031F867E5